MSKGGVIKLAVPHARQQRDGWCIPACIDMALRYLNNCHGSGITCLSQSEIVKLCGTTEGGTQWDATEDLNGQTSRFIPSVDFHLETNKKLKDIRKQLVQNQPVIAFVVMEADNEQYPHAILITGLDMGANRVFFNNPMGQQDEELDSGSFIAMWAKDFCVWFISIGRQRKIEDFAKVKR